MTNLVPTFFLGLRFDFRSASLLLLPVFLLARFPPLNPFISQRAKRGWIIYWGLASLLLVFFYVVDFAHYAYLGQRLNASVLNYLQDAGISMNMVWQSYPVLWLVLLLAGGTLVITWIINRTFQQVAKKPDDNNKKKNLNVKIFFIQVV